MPSYKTLSSTVKLPAGNIQLMELEEAEQTGVQVPKTGHSDKLSGQNIVTVELDKGQYVESFQPGPIKGQGGVQYSKVRQGIDSADVRKNSRFSVSELARGALSIEAEEEQRIMAEVERRIEIQFSKLREEVAAVAHEAGLAQGREEGKTLVQQEAKPQLERLEQLVREFEDMRFHVFKANEEMLMQMVYQLAKNVVLRNLEEDRDYTKRLIAHLLERTGARENIKLYVSAEAYSSAEAIKRDLVQSFGELKNISIEQDAEVHDKGCWLDTDFGEIDARIETQLKNLAKTLGATIATKPPGQDAQG